LTYYVVVVVAAAAVVVFTMGKYKPNENLYSPTIVVAV